MREEMEVKKTGERERQMCIDAACIQYAAYTVSKAGELVRKILDAFSRGFPYVENIQRELWFVQNDVTLSFPACSPSGQHNSPEHALFHLNGRQLQYDI